MALTEVKQEKKEETIKKKKTMKEKDMVCPINRLELSSFSKSAKVIMNETVNLPQFIFPDSVII